MAPVSVRDVRKSYGQQIVIHGVDLEIADGEFVVLVGPSGCGKSTLLRMVAGLEPISSGDIAIDGRVVNDAAPRDRDIAMVFQNYALYPHMSVAANMGFSLMLKKVSQAEIAARVKAAADILGLGALMHRYPRELSGGQRQRVAMGRAIVRDPKVFLFDEPLSNLDAKLRIEMRAEIKSLHHRLKTTTIYVTHDQIEAMTLADRIVVLHDGVVQQIGGPLDLYDRPRNTFVATFIGSPSMNLLEGDLAQEDGKRVFRLPDGACLPVGDAHDAGLGSKSVCGIRPEDFAVSPNGLRATVQIFEPLGSESQIVARLAGQDVVVLLRDRAAYAPGDVITLQPDLSRLHLFDAATGRRLDEGASRPVTLV